MATTVRASIDEQTIVFVLKMPESAPDPYTNEYFALVGVFPEKYVFHPQDTVPEQYLGGSMSNKIHHTPPKTPLMKRLQRSFAVPYDTFVYFVENNPLALVLRDIKNRKTQGPGPGSDIDVGHILPDHRAETIPTDVSATPTQKITTSAKVPQNESPNVSTSMMTSPSTSESTTNIEDAKDSEKADVGTQTIVLVFRRVPSVTDERNEEEGKSLPQIIETRTKGSIDTNAQGLTYPDLEQICRLQQFLRRNLFQRDVYCVNGRWFATLSGSESDAGESTIQDIDMSMLEGTWVKKLADKHTNT